MQYYFFILKSPILCPFRDLKNDNLLPKLSLFAYTYIENDMNVKYLFIYYLYVSIILISKVRTSK